MELFIDKESLQSITDSLEQEVTLFKTNIDNYYKELDSIHNYWSGDRFNLFIEQVEKNKDIIQKSHVVLTEYKDIIQESLNSYISLQEGINYNES